MMCCCIPHNLSPSLSFDFLTFWHSEESCEVSRLGTGEAAAAVGTWVVEAVWIAVAAEPLSLLLVAGRKKKKKRKV